MYNFNRVYRLTISVPPSIDSTPVVVTPEETTSLVVDKQGDYRTVDLDAVVITDLQMTASLSSGKNNGSGGSLNLSLKGTNADTRSFINKNSVIILEAGYDNTELSVIFAGQVVDKNVDLSQDISIVNIVAKDGYTPSNSVKVTAEFPENSSYQDILQFLIDTYADNGIPSGRPLSELATRVGKGLNRPINEMFFIDGYSLQGSYLDTALMNICKDIGFTYYFDKSKLYVEPEDYADNFIESFRIETNQILSSTEITPENNNNAKDTQESNSGYRLKILLDGRIDVGELVELTNPSGTFKVVKVSHSLDYEGSNWFTTLEVANV